VLQSYSRDWKQSSKERENSEQPNDRFSEAVSLVARVTVKCHEGKIGMEPLAEAEERPSSRRIQSLHLHLAKMEVVCRPVV
jgi:hypothetical protein